MMAVAGGSVGLVGGGGGGSGMRFSGDTPRRGYLLQASSSRLSFRGWATVEGRESSRTAAAAAASASASALASLTFYDLLGITTRDGVEEVKKAYKRMARKYHPDVSPPHCAEEHTRMFIEVQEAYETLSDPCRRAEYDKLLARGLTRLAFTGRTRRYDPEMEARSEWRNKWQDQISELQRRSDMKKAFLMRICHGQPACAERELLEYLIN